jgi:hypothetical protein
MEVADLPIVDHVPCWWLIECSLIVEHPLFKVMDVILILLCCNAGAGLPISNGLEEAIGDAL